MFSAGHGLLIFTQKCTYRIQLADQIDPKRENINLPLAVQQKLFDYGTRSELIGRTFLQGKTLFRKEFLPQIDNDAALKLCFEFLSEYVAMTNAMEDFAEAEKQAIATAEKGSRKGSSITIPAVGNVRPRCKTFSQKADHAVAKVFEIVNLFYDRPATGGWTAFAEFVSKTYGADDAFTEMMAIAAPFLQLVRNTRDCLEHNNKDASKISDFSLRSDGKIDPPIIEIHFRKSVLEPTAVSAYMTGTTINVLDCFEQMLVHLCAKNVKPFAGFPIYIAAVPPERRKDKHTRYAYGMFAGDNQFVPIG